MNNRILRMAVVIICIQSLIGCALPGPRQPIINPLLIDQKEAKEKLLSKYCALVVATNRNGFERATAICRQIAEGQINLAYLKTSDNERYALYMFKEMDSQSEGDYRVIAFHFNPGADMIRSCHNDLCDIHVRNGVFQFGRFNVTRNGEPNVTDSGISIKFDDNQSASYDLLFSYGKGHEGEGNELISIFLSAFPFPSLSYQ